MVVCPQPTSIGDRGSKGLIFFWTFVHNFSFQRLEFRDSMFFQVFGKRSGEQLMKTENCLGTFTERGHFAGFFCLGNCFWKQVPNMLSYQFSFSLSLIIENSF